MLIRSTKQEGSFPAHPRRDPPSILLNEGLRLLTLQGIERSCNDKHLIRETTLHKARSNIVSDLVLVAATQPSLRIVSRYIFYDQPTGMRTDAATGTRLLPLLGGGTSFIPGYHLRGGGSGVIPAPPTTESDCGPSLPSGSFLRCVNGEHAAMLHTLEAHDSATF